MAMLDVKNISKSFGATRVLEDISFSLEQGETVAVIGASGSGKTTLLRCLTYLEKADKGTVAINGQTVFDAASQHKLTDSELRDRRLHFGMVFQSFNLFPQYTALENVMLAGQLLAKERPDYKSRKKEINQEVEAKAKELGINLQWVGPTTSDAGQQVTVIEGLIEKQVDGILISCNDADALKDVIDRAVDAGIVVGCFDSDSPESKRAFYCGTDNYAVGKLAAEEMMKILPDGGKVAILTGVLGAPNLEERIRGFKETVEGSNIEVMPVQTGNDDVQTSVDVVGQYTAANPDLAAWFFVGGWPYFADPDALPEVQKFMENGGHIISVDTCEPMMQAVP